MTSIEAKFILEEIKEFDDTLYSYSESYMNALDEAIKALEEVQEYRKLGTVEDVRRAIQKQNPIKAIGRGMRCPRYHCPICKNFIGWGIVGNYCQECGQKLDKDK